MPGRIEQCSIDRVVVKPCLKKVAIERHINTSQFEFRYVFETKRCETRLK